MHKVCIAELEVGHLVTNGPRHGLLFTLVIVCHLGLLGLLGGRLRDVGLL